MRKTEAGKTEIRETSAVKEDNWLESGDIGSSGQGKILMSIISEMLSNQNIANAEEDKRAICVHFSCPHCGRDITLQITANKDK